MDILKPHTLILPDADETEVNAKIKDVGKVLTKWILCKLTGKKKREFKIFREAENLAAVLEFDKDAKRKAYNEVIEKHNKAIDSPVAQDLKKLIMVHGIDAVEDLLESVLKVDIDLNSNGK